jgi:hypothetical protein
VVPGRGQRGEDRRRRLLRSTKEENQEETLQATALVVAVVGAEAEEAAVHRLPTTSLTTMIAWTCQMTMMETTTCQVMTGGPILAISSVASKIW